VAMQLGVAGHGRGPVLIEHMFDHSPRPAAPAVACAVMSDAPAAPAPMSLRTFLTVWAGQLVSITRHHPHRFGLQVWCTWRPGR